MQIGQFCDDQAYSKTLALMTRYDRVGYTGGFFPHTYMYMHMCM